MTPQQPAGVRLAAADGTEIRCSLLYDGNRDGIDHWVAIPDFPMIYAPGLTLRLDTLPARTEVTLALAVREER